MSHQDLCAQTAQLMPCSASGLLEQRPPTPNLAATLKQGSRLTTMRERCLPRPSSHSAYKHHTYPREGTDWTCIPEAELARLAQRVVLYRACGGVTPLLFDSIRLPIAFLLHCARGSPLQATLAVSPLKP